MSRKERLCFVEEEVNSTIKTHKEFSPEEIKEPLENALKAMKSGYPRTIMLRFTRPDDKGIPTVVKGIFSNINLRGLLQLPQEEKNMALIELFTTVMAADEVVIVNRIVPPERRMEITPHQSSPIPQPFIDFINQMDGTFFRTPRRAKHEVS